MSFFNKSFIRILLVPSLVFGSLTAKLILGDVPANALQSLPFSSQTNVSKDYLRLSLFQTENKNFLTRIEALNAVKDRGLVPRSQSFISQWENGNNTARAGSSNYVLEKTRQASWGNYYVYKVGSQYFVIAEHTNDPDAPCPAGWAKPCKHFHVGTAGTSAASFLQSKTPDTAAIEFFKSKDYVQVGVNHHYFYQGN